MAEHDGIRLSWCAEAEAGDHGSFLLRGFAGAFLEGRFLDAFVRCADGVAVSCHGAVLAALSPMLAEALEGCSRREEDAVLVAPELASADLRGCLEAVYGCGAGARSTLTGEAEEVLEVLGFRNMILASDVEVKDELCQASDDMTGYGGHEDAEPTSRGSPKRKRHATTLEPDSPPHIEPKIRILEDCEDRTVIGPDDFRNLMESKTGSLIVTVKKSGEDDSEVIPAYPGKAQFMALLGVKLSDDGVTNALPLTWSVPEAFSDEEILPRFKQFGEALGSVFGFSRAETFGQRVVRPLLGARRNLNVEKAQISRELSNYDRESLKELLSQGEVAEASKSGPSQKSLDGFCRDGEEIVLNVASSMAVGEISSLAIVTMDKANRIECRFIKTPSQVSSCKSEMRDGLCQDLIRLFVKATLLRTKRKKFERCPALASFYHKFAALKRKYEIATEMLSSGVLPDVTLQEQCPDCGEVFDVSAGRKEFARHKRKHYLEKFQCDCEVTWTNLSQKANHITLVHKNKGQKKCDQCDFIGKEKALANHVATSHTPVTCAFCGIIVKRSHKLAEHVAAKHPERASEDMLKKRKQLSGFCEICQRSYQEIDRHNIVRHSADSEVVCTECGKVLKKSTIKLHMLYMHTPNEQLRFPCTRCDRRFPTNEKLRRHIEGIHDKLLLYACQFDGCDKRYSHSATLSKHQVMQHGHSYPAAVRKGLVKPKSDK